MAERQLRPGLIEFTNQIGERITLREDWIEGVAENSDGGTVITAGEEFYAQEGYESVLKRLGWISTCPLALERCGQGNCGSGI